MATMGYTGIGATQQGMDANRIGLCPVTAPSTGTIKSISLYTNNYTGANIKAFLVNASLAIVATSIPVFTYNSVNEWVEFFFATPPSVTSGTTYYLGFMGDSGTGYVYNAGTGVINKYDTSNNYASPTDPTDAGTLVDGTVSIYATYTDGEYLVDYYFGMTDSQANVQPEYSKRGQSFTVTSATTLKNIRLNIDKVNTPTGNAYVKLYAHTGTYGTSSVPTGSALATSDALDTSTVTTARLWYTFNFSTPYVMTASTYYTFAIEHADCSNTNYIRISRDASSPTHGGNFIYWDTAWAANNTQDMEFYVVGTPYVAPTGQYMSTNRGYW